MSILFQVTLDRANRRKDKSVSMGFISCLELTSEQFMSVDEQLSNTGILYFKAKNNLTEEEIQEIDNIDVKKEGKSKSQRLRNTLYVLNKETTNENFQEFYDSKMEEVIEHFKKQIP